MEINNKLRTWEIIIGVILLNLTMSLPLAKVDIDLKMGVFSPDTDPLVMQTYGKDFYWQGMLGIIDDSGLEIRANVGHYDNVSHHPLDVGYNRRIGITPIFASLIYNLPLHIFVIKPYLGGGVGAYFYQVKDDVIGELESGTKFGVNAVIGARIDINEKSYLIGEYTKHFIKPIFFNNATNFDSSSLIIGVGFYFPLDNRNSSSLQKYKYSQREEELLVDIQQAETDVLEMGKKRDQMQFDIDAFYKSSDYNANDVQFNQNYQRIKFMESKIEVLTKQLKEAKTNLGVLEKKWALEHQDNQPVQNHIIYLQNNYEASPYGLSYRNGSFRRPNNSFRSNSYSDNSYNYQQPVITNTAETVETRKEFAEKKKKVLEELKNRTLQ